MFRKAIYLLLSVPLFSCWLLPPGDVWPGAAAALGQYPFMGYFYRTGEKSHYAKCSAVVVNPEWVLTAKHCVKNMDYNFVFIGGINARGSKKQQGSAHRIDRSLNRNYFIDHETLDVALVKLEDKVVPSDNSQISIRLSSNFEVNEDSTFRILGFGRSKYYKNALTWEGVPVDLNQSCKRTFKGVTNWRSHLCAGKKKKTVCSGDSGGALIARNPDDGAWLHYGIPIKVDGLCNSAGLFIRADEIKEWVDETIARSQ